MKGCSLRGIVALYVVVDDRCDLGSRTFRRRHFCVLYFSCHVCVFVSFVRFFFFKFPWTNKTKRSRVIKQ